ncbi:hypothetical protein [Kordiimonas sp.]|uniref:hypothetical protein n=1 Tax=Kordiimonas sp. TaxID=1970157 RepID=UPI003A8D9F67
MIHQNQIFTVKRNGRIDTFRRECDDVNPRFECERIRVTHLGSSDVVNWKPYTFGTESEWFRQRGLVCSVEEKDFAKTA